MSRKIEITMRPSAVLSNRSCSDLRRAVASMIRPYSA
jgi:hypothetical protein